MTNKHPTLTIGLAHANDFEGLWQTVQSIRVNNLSLMPQIELIIVDNSTEDQATSNAIKGLISNCSNLANAKYVPLPDVKGTSISRQTIFDHATGEIVLVMDCHVELWPGALQSVIDYFRSTPDSKDIISGPLMFDSLQNCATHFDDEWNDAMWGVWAQAWKCKCGPDGEMFSMGKVDEKTVPRTLTLNPTPVTTCKACKRTIPSGIAWAGHENKYLQDGFFPLGFNNTEPFEVPGQGLGLFACRREVWPGFAKHTYGFGGEELWIHERFRRNGGRAMCMPALKWVHRFYRSGGHKYPNKNYWKARNYVLEFNELGMDLEPIRKHFVESNVKADLPRITHYITPEAWQALVDDPIMNVEDPTERLNAIKSAAGLMPEITSSDQLFDLVTGTARDLNEHMPELRRLTEVIGSSGTVIEFTGRKESTVAFLAARPSKVISYTTEADGNCFKMANLVSNTTQFMPKQYKMGDIVTSIPEHDICFIDTFHRFEQVTKELAAYAPKCRRYIVLHDTDVYGHRGDDNGLGLIQAIAEFCDTHQEWAVISHTKQQYGLTVLSRNPDDRPEVPVEGFNVPRGPGTELKKILHSLGIHPSPSCGCHAKANHMDAWGIDGCQEPDKFQTIVGWLKEGTWNGLDLASAAARSFFTGIAWHINPLHPFESLVHLCIQRARDAEEKRSKAA